MTGRWEQAWRLLHRRRFMQYFIADGGRERPTHRQWHRIILPIDHPFWSVWYPLNDWLCRCVVRTLSQAQMDA